MDHIFGSKWPINELSRLGFSISYGEINCYKQQRFMLKDLPEDAFVQYSGDNVDHITCTIDGSMKWE